MALWPARRPAGGMKTLIIQAADAVALACDAATVLLVAIGGALALWRVLVTLVGLDHRLKRDIWLRFAAWIVLALEFALGGDIIHTAFEPRWEEIGQLAAIAAIRTALNFFLARDLETAEAEGKA